MHEDWCFINVGIFFLQCCIIYKQYNIITIFIFESDTIGMNAKGLFNIIIILDFCSTKIKIIQKILLSFILNSI